MRQFSKTTIFILTVLACSLAVTVFLWRSVSFAGLGFPLDDAWIHQTYARNLATRGEWAFIPGQVSTGSTSPLWTTLLSIGYLLGLSPTLFSYFIGLLTLIATAWVMGSSLRVHPPILLYGIMALLIFEWHAVWAAVSGMETLLLGLHLIVILYLLGQDSNQLAIGALAGLGIWIRPDALLVGLPIAWWVLTEKTTVRRKARQASLVLAGFIMLAGPYLIMNLSLGGEVWPSTFYAKQVEYAVVREAPILDRWVRMAFAPMIGTGLLMVPGVVIDAWDTLRSRAWPHLAGLIWFLAFVSVYAVRLPVDYQHGRYMIPVIPALFLLGIRGLLKALRTGERSPVTRIVSRVWLICCYLVTVIFWFLGAEAYATDVAVIETEMVAAANWLSENTEDAAVIAAHDIGALGYFGGRQIIDLAGLISPEVIPILRDEVALEAFIQREQADYLMTFPGWYPLLTADRLVVFSTGASVSPLIGGENMTIYRWP